MAVTLGKNPESIYEAGLNDIVYTFALFLGESFVPLIFFRSSEVFWLVRYIQVAAEDYRFTLP